MRRQSILSILFWHGPSIWHVFTIISVHPCLKYYCPALVAQWWACWTPSFFWGGGRFFGVFFMGWMKSDLRFSFFSRFPNLHFDYKDPEKNFDRNRVKGLVCKLFKVKNPQFAKALEVTAGAKVSMYFIILLWSIEGLSLVTGSYFAT